MWDFENKVDVMIYRSEDLEMWTSEIKLFYDKSWGLHRIQENEDN